MYNVYTDEMHNKTQTRAVYRLHAEPIGDISTGGFTGTHDFGDLAATHAVVSVSTQHQHQHQHQHEAAE